MNSQGLLSGCLVSVIYTISLCFPIASASFTGFSLKTWRCSLQSHTLFDSEKVSAFNVWQLWLPHSYCWRINSRNSQRGPKNLHACTWWMDGWIMDNFLHSPSISCLNHTAARKDKCAIRSEPHLILILISQSAFLLDCHWIPTPYISCQ